MKTLNRRDFPGAQYPERIIQFGEGNFLRAFVDWQIDLLNEHTDLNSGVVVVRPIETSFPPSLSTQDGLYTTIIRGLNEKGEAVSDARLIRSVNREISVYSEYDEFLKLAHNPEMRFVFSNTTEAGISYHAGDKFDDAPAVSYPAKLTRLLFERFSHFNGALDKGVWGAMEPKTNVRVYHRRSVPSSHAFASTLQLHKSASRFISDRS
ncbi:altronate oxidoreductase [Escherichia coli]|nr:altronate oxidoreductase [Escherichia coli]